MKKEEKLIAHAEPEVRPLTVLTRLRHDRTCEYKETLSELKSDLDVERNEIDDSFSDYSPMRFEDEMEIHAKKTKVEKGTDAYGDEVEINHYDIRLGFVPKESSSYKYSSKDRETCMHQEKKGTYDLDPLSSEIQYDIVKDRYSLLFSFLYMLMRNKDFSEEEKRDAVAYLRRAHIVFDSVDLEDNASFEEKGLNWLRGVGTSLLEAYRDDLESCVYNILDGNVYIVYGVFDPNTRKNLLFSDTENSKEGSD